MDVGALWFESTRCDKQPACERDRRCQRYQTDGGVFASPTVGVQQVVAKMQHTPDERRDCGDPYEVRRQFDRGVDEDCSERQVERADVADQMLR